jgi:hypothetical protein
MIVTISEKLNSHTETKKRVFQYLNKTITTLRCRKIKIKNPSRVIILKKKFQKLQIILNNETKT